MSDSIDKSKLMAYVHGELDEQEARAFTELLNRDEQARTEVEALMQTSASLESYYSVGTNESLNPEQLARIRRKAEKPKSFWQAWTVFAGGLAVAGLAAVVFYQTWIVENSKPEAASIAQLTPEASPPAAEMSDMDTEMEILKEEELAGAEAEHEVADTGGAFGGEARGGSGARLGGLAARAKGESADARKDEAPELKRQELAAQAEVAESEELATAEELQAFAAPTARPGSPPAEPFPPDAPSAKADAIAAAPAKPAKMMAKKEPAPDPQKAAYLSAVGSVEKKVSGSGGRISFKPSNAVVSPNLQKDTILAYIATHLDGDNTCVPPESGIKHLALILEIARAGAFTSVKSEPAVPKNILDCLKTKLQSDPGVFKPSDSAPARVKIQLDIQ